MPDKVSMDLKTASIKKIHFNRKEALIYFFIKKKLPQISTVTISVKPLLRRKLT